MKPYLVRMFSEVDCDFALWGDAERPLPESAVLADVGELEALLPISDRLRERLLDWAALHLRWDSGDRTVSMSGFDETGMWLSQALRNELGPDYSVEYHFTFAASRERLKRLAEAKSLPGWYVR